MYKITFATTSRTTLIAFERQTSEVIHAPSMAPADAPRIGTFNKCGANSRIAAQTPA